MKKMVLKAVISIVSLLSIINCDSNRSVFKDAPLKDDMSFTYIESMTYQGRTLSRTISLKFKKEGDVFTCYSTITDEYGPREKDPLQVDGFFRYDEVLEYLVSSYALWRDPDILSSGSIGTMKVIKGTHNGKSVYTTVISDKEEAHYAVDTGYLEGAHIDLGDKSQTVVRINLI